MWETTLKFRMTSTILPRLFLTRPIFSYCTIYVNKILCFIHRPVTVLTKGIQVVDPRYRNNPRAHKYRMKIEKRELELPRGWDGKLAFALDNVFTKEECEKYIADSEARGYELALVNIGGGRQKQMTDVRNSSRNIWDSKEEVQRMFSRIKDYIPEVWKDRKCLGLNERLRFLRYDPGEYFKPHLDGSYVRENGERSYITVQIYLNEGFEGGSTTFMSWDENERVEYVPKTGSVLIFQHDILHEGSQLIKGRKYSIRTDVMYSLETVQELKKGKKSKLLSWLPW